MKKKAKGGRPPGVVTQERKRRTIQLLGEGKTQAQIARALGVTDVAVCRSLKELRKTMTTATAADFETYRKGQLSILELIEENLLTGKVEPEIAREWRQIRGDIAKLMGLNAPERSLNVTVDASADPSKMGLYQRFLYETRHMDAARIEQVFAFAKTLNLPGATIEVHPPETSEMWEEDEQ